MMNRLLKALLTSLWFVVLCAPIMGIHINPNHSVIFRWQRLVGLAPCRERAGRACRS